MGLCKGIPFTLCPNSPPFRFGACALRLAPPYITEAVPGQRILLDKWDEK